MIISELAQRYARAAGITVLAEVVQRILDTEERCKQLEARLEKLEKNEKA